MLFPLEIICRNFLLLFPSRAIFCHGNSPLSPHQILRKSGSLALSHLPTLSLSFSLSGSSIKHPLASPKIGLATPRESDGRVGGRGAAAGRTGRHPQQSGGGVVRPGTHPERERVAGGGERRRGGVQVAGQRVNPTTGQVIVSYRTPAPHPGGALRRKRPARLRRRVRCHPLHPPLSVASRPRPPCMCVCIYVCA